MANIAARWTMGYLLRSRGRSGLGCLTEPCLTELCLAEHGAVSRITDRTRLIGHDCRVRWPLFPARYASLAVRVYTPCLGVTPRERT
jgi:hypothetical protein